MRLFKIMTRPELQKMKNDKPIGFVLHASMRTDKELPLRLRRDIEYVNFFTSHISAYIYQACRSFSPCSSIICEFEVPNRLAKRFCTQQKYKVFSHKDFCIDLDEVFIPSRLFDKDWYIGTLSSKPRQEKTYESETDQSEI